MYIKRDYSQPFFSNRRRRRSVGRLMFVYIGLIALFLGFVYTQFDRLRLVALDVVGLAPTATPFASTLATEGASRFREGDVARAAELFALAVAQQPDNLDYLYEYGKLLIELDRADEAIPLADHAIEIGEFDPRGYALKTKAMVWLDDAAGAIPVGVAGMEVDNQFAPLFSALARAYTAIGRYQQGLEYGETAIGLDPMDADAHRSYAYTLIWVGEREAAISQLEEAIAINPNLTAPYFELGIQYKAADRDDWAIATYEHILSLEPRNERAHLRLCEAYAKIGQQNRAEDYCDDALTINPEYAPAWRQVGIARYTQRNYEGAIEAFQKCVDFGSTEIQCWYLRGLAHYYLGQCDDAWNILTESLPLAEQIPDGENIVSSIREGLRLTTFSCPTYAGQSLPTEIPPTPIPPTPIGG